MKENGYDGGWYGVRGGLSSLLRCDCHCAGQTCGLRAHEDLHEVGGAECGWGRAGGACTSAPCPHTGGEAEDVGALNLTPTDQKYSQDR